MAVDGSVDTAVRTLGRAARLLTGVEPAETLSTRR